jgi:class 3 adenylate cyclase
MSITIAAAKRIGERAICSSINVQNSFIARIITPASTTTLGSAACGAGPAAWRCRRRCAAPQDSAERRQISVMFSDLVSSTALSARMDPEDLRAVISAYQKCVAQAVQRLAGAQMVILAVRSDRFRKLTRRRSLVCLATCGYRPKRLDLAFADADIPVVHVAGRITVPRHEPQLLIDLQYALGIVDDAVLV